MKNPVKKLISKLQELVDLPDRTLALLRRLAERRDRKLIQQITESYWKTRFYLFSHGDSDGTTTPWGNRCRQDFVRDTTNLLLEWASASASDPISDDTPQTPALGSSSSFRAPSAGKRRSPNEAFPDESPESGDAASPGKRIRTINRQTHPSEPTSPSASRSNTARLRPFAGTSFSARGREQQPEPRAARPASSGSLLSKASPPEHAQEYLSGAAAAKLSLTTSQPQAELVGIDLVSEPARTTKRSPAPAATTAGRRGPAAASASAIKSQPTVVTTDDGFNEIVPSDLRAKIMQKQADRAAVPWGTQFFLASLVSHGFVSWDHLTLHGIKLLRSESNLDSMRQLFKTDVQENMWDNDDGQVRSLSRPITNREVETYHELDREVAALVKDKFAGLGTTEAGEPNLFGGKVIFEGEITFKDLSKEKGFRQPKAGSTEKVAIYEYGLHLSPPRLGPSCRFARRFGSERFIRLKLPAALYRALQRGNDEGKRGGRAETIRTEFLEFLLRPFRLLGRVFRPLLAKDSTIWLLQVDEMYPSAYPLEIRSIWDFVDYHGPWHRNASSKMGKFLQRMVLGVSTSFPACTVDAIRYEEDLYGDAYDSEGSRRVMTDGAASASQALLQAVSERLAYEKMPSAIQARIAGAKGVWFLEAGSRPNFPGVEAPRSIVVRDSQKKLDLPSFENMDRSHHYVDLLMPAKAIIPSTLSRQIILVMNHGGVPSSVFQAMQEAQLTRIVERFSQWSSDEVTALFDLAKVVNEYGKVESTKAKLAMLASEQRAKGLLSRVGDEAEAAGDAHQDQFFDEKGQHMWTGKPRHKPTCAFEMLLAGFHPASNPILAGYLEELAKQAMDQILKKFACPIDGSGEAMCIPDPAGVLEEGEIQFLFSNDSVLDPVTKRKISHVPEGDVLITRHPCLLPTDVRKVRAVVKPELKAYEDVIVFSTRGKRPLADFLSGGDYDGDQVRCFWEPEIVKPFRNAPEHFADCPFQVEDVFTQQQEEVCTFLGVYENEPGHIRDDALIERLMKPVFAYNLRGLYGKMHLAAAYQHGCDSNHAVVLAHKFNKCMDAPKTGLLLKNSVRLEDTKRYAVKLPEWDDKDDGLDELRKENPFIFDDVGSHDRAARRDPKLERCVLDVLFLMGRELATLLRAQLKLRLNACGNQEDKALTRPWKQAMEDGRLNLTEIVAIQDHVRTMIDCYKLTNSQIRAQINRRKEAQARGSGLATRGRSRLAGSNPFVRTKSAPMVQLGDPKLGRTGMKRVTSDVRATPQLREEEGYEYGYELHREQGEDAADLSPYQGSSMTTFLEHSGATTAATTVTTPSTSRPSTPDNDDDEPDPSPITPIIGPSLVGPPEQAVAMESGSEVERYFCTWPLSFRTYLATAKRDEFDLVRLETLRASYAYLLCYQRGWSFKYAFDLAWSTLLQLRHKDTAKKRLPLGSSAENASLGFCVYPHAMERLKLGIRKA